MFGESYKEHSVNLNIRKWNLGSRVLSEKDTWFNLGKIWDITKGSSGFVSKAVKKGRETSFVLIKMGARYEGINPVISCKLWKRIGIPRVLYGTELIWTRAYLETKNCRA